MRTALVFGLLLLAAGCRRPSATTAPGDGGAPEASTALRDTSFVLGDEFGYRGALWASNGDAVAVTSSALVRVPPRKDAVARLLRVPDGEGLEVAAAAKRADVLAALTPRGKVLVWKDNGPAKVAAELTGSAGLAVSDDGAFAAVWTDGDGVMFHLVDLARGAVVGAPHVVPRKGWERDRAAFDRTGKWLAVSGPLPQADWARPGEMSASTSLVPTDGSPSRSFDNLTLRGWVGGTLVLQRRGEVALLDPAAKTPRRVPVCPGDLALVDEKTPRVASLCNGRVDVVRVEDGVRVVVPLPGGLDAEAGANIAPAREGEDLVLRLADGTVFRIDVAARAARKVEDGEQIPIRTAEGTPLAPAALAIASCARCQLAPDGTHWLDEARTGHQAWPLALLEPGERWASVAKISWGGQNTRIWWPRNLHLNEGGLDWEYEVENGTETRARVRLGPDALMTPDPPEVPESREIRGHPCPAEAHLATPRGELWYERGGRRCVCADYTCKTEFGPETFSILDARQDSVAFVWHESAATNIEIWSSEGAKRSQARIEDECVDGRLSADGKLFSMVCRARQRPTDAGTQDDPMTRWELVELDAVTGMGTRTTPLPRSTATPRLLGFTKGSVLVATGSYDHGAPATLVEAGSGRVRAHVQGFEDHATNARAVVARFPDGKVEIVGDEGLAERALFCERAGELRPFATCRAELRVKGRFRL